MEEEKVVEWLFDTTLNGPKPGEVIAGRVTDILPGMEAAFVDIGSEKNGFLLKKELIAFHQADSTATSKSISSLVTKGQSIIVQVKKEETGTKGAKLTEILSFPGKYLVYLPHGGYVAVSKKMKDADLREQWRDLSHTWLENPEGVILRTLAEDVDEQIVLNELNRLREVYRSIVHKANNKTSSTVTLYDESSIYARVIRDFLNDDETQIVVDDMSDYKQMVKHLPTEKLWKVEFYQGKEGLFTYYSLSQKLEKSLNPFVWLKNGGSLNIDYTEAMTVIDVNSAKFIGKQGLRETILETNIEAAKTIADQLRLREIGGIIIIDFIDMKTDEDRAKVLKTLKTALRPDRTTTNVLGFTQLGLVEMTRKKTRKPLHEALQTKCLCCNGTGKIKKDEEIARELEEHLFSLRFHDEEALLVEVEERVMSLFLKNGKKRIKQIEEMISKIIFLSPNQNESGFDVRLMGETAELYDRWKVKRSK